MKVTAVKVEGHPNYLVRDDGLVWSTNVNRFLKPELGTRGYRRVNLNGKRYLVHRLVAMAFLPNVNSKPQVNHIDGNKSNNALTNLEWATASENGRHASETGLYKAAKGIACGRSKLSERQVIEILDLLQSGNTALDIASQLEGVTRQTVRDIRVNRTWKHINHPYKDVNYDS